MSSQLATDLRLPDYRLQFFFFCISVGEYGALRRHHLRHYHLQSQPLGHGASFGTCPEWHLGATSEVAGHLLPHVP